MTLAAGDVVFWSGCAGRIRICGEEGGAFFVLIEIWQHAQVVVDQVSTWTVSSRRRCVADALQVEMVCAWRFLDDTEQLCLVVRH